MASPATSFDRAFFCLRYVGQGHRPDTLRGSNEPVSCEGRVIHDLLLPCRAAVTSPAEGGNVSRRRRAQESFFSIGSGWSAFGVFSK